MGEGCVSLRSNSYASGSHRVTSDAASGARDPGEARPGRLVESLLGLSATQGRAEGPVAAHFVE